MKWSIEDGAPPGGHIVFNGAEARRVTAFDTDEGWIEQHCLDGHTGRPGEAHLDPDDPTKVCMAPRRYGDVSWRPGKEDDAA